MTTAQDMALSWRGAPGAGGTPTRNYQFDFSQIAGLMPTAYYGDGESARDNPTGYDAYKKFAGADGQRLIAEIIPTVQRQLMEGENHGQGEQWQDVPDYNTPQGYRVYKDTDFGGGYLGNQHFSRLNGQAYDDYNLDGTLKGNGIFQGQKDGLGAWGFPAVMALPFVGAGLAAAGGAGGAAGAAGAAEAGAAGAAGAGAAEGAAAGLGGFLGDATAAGYAGLDAASASTLGGGASGAWGGGLAAGAGAAGTLSGGAGGVGGAGVAGAGGSLVPGVSNSTLAKLGLTAATSLTGGGGDAGDGGLADMQNTEAQRQAKTQAAVDAINRQFGYGAGGEANKGSRDSMYADISGAVRDTAMRDLDRQYGTASKRNTFGLARSGLLGGSADAEAGGELKSLYGEGQLKATQAGQGAASDLRLADEKTRQNLISLSQSGLDTGTAATLGASQLSANADSARSAASGATVGRLFDDLSQAYVQNQTLKARYPNGLPQQTSGYSGGNLYGTNRYTGSPGG